MKAIAYVCYSALWGRLGLTCAPRFIQASFFVVVLCAEIVSRESGEGMDFVGCGAVYELLLQNLPVPYTWCGWNRWMAG